MLKFNNYTHQTHSADFKHLVDSGTINSHSINNELQNSLLQLLYEDIIAKAITAFLETNRILRAYFCQLFLVKKKCVQNHTVSMTAM